MRLGSLLIRDSVITLEQLEAALRTQVLFGGKLGTNLVELGHLSLDQLTTYLSRTLSFPAATEAQFLAADPSVLGLLDAGTAWRCVAYPLAHEPGGALGVAVANPANVAIMDALREKAGVPIVAYVAPELRIEAFLEQVYEPPAGIVRASRAHRAPTRAVDPNAVHTPPISLTPRVPRGLAEPPTHLPTPASARKPSRVTALRPPTTSLSESLDRLEHAGSRDEIGDELVRFARGRVEAAILFLVKDGRALGWKGFGGDGNAPLDAMVVVVAPPSPLAVPLVEKKPWRGRLDSHSIPDGLRGSLPAGEALIAPICLGDTVVNLFYGCARVALEDGAVDALLSVVEAAGEAYARLIGSASSRG